MALRHDSATINISGISVSGVGGLGLVAIAALTTWVLPQAWWLVAIGAAGGCVLGLAIVAFRRHHTSPGPSGDDPHILFRATDDDGSQPATDEHRSTATDEHRSTLKDLFNTNRSVLVRVGLWR
jgi:sugar phosphate permease